MSHLLLSSDLSFLALPLDRTIVYALWYSTILWLPIRLLAAVIDRRRAITIQDEAVTDIGYRIGMDVVPPL